MKKHTIFILVIVMIFTIVIPASADDMSDNIKRINTINGILSTNTMITPMYIPHPCHSGISHALCEWESYDLIQCGCSTTIWYCCCGIKMRSAFLPCDDHGINRN